VPEGDPDDPAVLFCTSGTTGTTKGVPVSHGNLAFQLNTLLEADLVTEDDRVLRPLRGSFAASISL
jgi:long-chain acyl-CoA synthetase